MAELWRVDSDRSNPDASGAEASILPRLMVHSRRFITKRGTVTVPPCSDEQRYPMLHVAASSPSFAASVGGHDYIFSDIL